MLVRTVAKIMYQDYQVKKVPEPRNSVFFLLEKVLGTRKEKLQANWSTVRSKSISFGHSLVLLKLHRRRLNQEPIQYLLGKWHFRGLNLYVKRPILIPRPETERIVDLVLERYEDTHQDLNVLEVGVGTGAISISLLKEYKNMKCDGIDILQKAINLTKRNVSLNFSEEEQVLEKRFKLHHESIKSYTDQCLESSQPKIYDLIVSNPPYIASEKLSHLEDQVKNYESPLALDGGKDGLDIIRDILFFAQKFLKAEGYIFLEIDNDQEQSISTLCSQYSGLAIESIIEDYYGQIRYALITKK